MLRRFNLRHEKLSELGECKNRSNFLSGGRFLTSGARLFRPLQAGSACGWADGGVLRRVGLVNRVGAISRIGAVGRMGGSSQIARSSQVARSSQLMVAHNLGGLLDDLF